MAEPTVLVKQAEGVTRLVLNRPDKLNAFNRAMHTELRAAIEAAAADASCRVIVLTGAGRAFSAGQDLADSGVNQGSGVEAGSALELYYNPLVRLLAGLEAVIAAVNGVAAGASANIALACDFVLAARSASFLQAFMRIGLIPDAGGTWLLPQLVGPARARGLAMLAEPLPAEKAEAWGLIWKAVDDDKLEAEVSALATRLANAPTYALGLAKKAIAAAATNTLSQQLDMERDFQKLAGISPDAREGVTAFLEKRPARFTGEKALMRSAQEVAQASAAAMWAEDNACKAMEMRVLEVTPGFARLDMVVGPAMTNGHGICHGGFIFSLADSAFAYACNSYGQRTVAQHCAVTFVAPGRLGSRLTAEARERTRSERSGIYDVTVRDEAGAVIAEFRGHSRTLPTSLLEGKG